MNAGRERTLILYVVAAAFALAFGALARFRYLKAHGR
jgi:hypothetical protein